MTSASESVTSLSRALDQLSELLEHVHADNLHAATPCRDWDVATLVGHIIGGARKFTRAARGEQPDWAAPPEPVTADWTATFDAAADDLRHAWHQAGDAASAQAVDWQVAELAVHAWDLARALGRPTRALDAEVAERGLAFMSQALTPENRGEAFGPAVDVADDAPAPDRIAAFAGRDPSA
ncbi:MAG TPA: TIGR03086 family metal-binding protein [Marmoricola sp.]|nr:TIGR03086 family metal-binding protein [Marmoricola sp.]